MKKSILLVFLVTFSIFGQQKQTDSDYFVQFNMPQLSKKMVVNSLFSHKIFKDLNRSTSFFNLNDFVPYMNSNKPIVIHGKFTDSISYNQTTFAIKDEKQITQFIQKKIDDEKDYYDSIPTIKKRNGFQVFSPKYSSFSIAWNKDYFVIYEMYENQKSTNYDTYSYDTIAVDSTSVYDIEAAPIEVMEDEPMETIEVIEAPAEDYPVVQAVDYETERTPKEAATQGVLDAMGIPTTESYELPSYYPEEVDASEELLAMKAKQEEQVIALFEKGFVMPYSFNLTANADIATWVNYQAFSNKMYDFYKVFQTFAPKNLVPMYSNTINGMHFDFYFENDKARMEQLVVYSHSLAGIMEKVSTRKPNKDFFTYFPKEAPMGFMTYHVNTEEMLHHYPAMTEQLFAMLPLEKEDSEIMMDLFSTLIDEEAAASLFDGDLALFYHGMEPYDFTYKTFTYDSDYNRVETEKKMQKSRPVFSMVFTSTHKKMVLNMLEMGVRKNLLVKENNHYVMNNEKDLGKIILFKAGDVVIVTNGLQHLNKGSMSEFSKKMKKEIKTNYFYGNFDIQRFMKNIMLNQDFGNDTEKMIKFSNQFKNLEFKSEKKIENNTMKLELNLNSNFSDKNIIMQTLDLFDFLN